MAIAYYTLEPKLVFAFKSCLCYNNLYLIYHEVHEWDLILFELVGAGLSIEQTTWSSNMRVL